MSELLYEDNVNKKATPERDKKKSNVCARRKLISSRFQRFCKKRSIFKAIQELIVGRILRFLKVSCLWENLTNTLFTVRFSRNRRYHHPIDGHKS